MRTAASDIDRVVRVTPSPAKVAALWASHGHSACLERWHWLDNKAISNAIRVGLALREKGETFSTRRSSVGTARELAAVETAFQLGAMRSAQFAAGVTESTLSMACTLRGIGFLERPKMSGEGRARATVLSKRANRGDAAAAAEIERERAHNRAVFRVVEAALALVPEQPPTGRPRLPEPSDALREALSGHDRAAVEQVFPKLFEGESHE